MSQLSLFSADLLPPSALDLEGLLAGPGQLVRRGGQARVSVLVVGGWRVAGLSAELTRRDLEVEAVSGRGSGSTLVRTGFSPALLPLVHRWSVGATARPPAGFALDGARLRLWCMAAGEEAAGREPAYSLRLGPHDADAWPAVGAALARAGLPGAFLGPRAAGPAYRIVGRRRLARLRELIGDPPPDAPGNGWPPVPG